MLSSTTWTRSSVRSADTSRKQKSISSSVPSTQVTRRGGREGLTGFAAELSNTPSVTIRVPAGKTLDRKGKPLLIKLKGQVEVYYR